MSSLPRGQGAIRYANEDAYTGTVTSVATGTGLTGGPITGTGTINLANTAVTPGAYTLMSGTVDQQGRLTAAASGTAVTSVASGTGLTGGPITTTGTLSLANTAVTPGSYTSANITVDQQGRITAASNGSGVIYTTIDITPAEYKALPKVILPAPPAGQYYFFESACLEFTYGSTMPSTGVNPMNIVTTGYATPVLALSSSACDGSTTNSVSQFIRGDNIPQTAAQLALGWSIDSSVPFTGVNDGSFRLKLAYRLITFG